MGPGVLPSVVVVDNLVQLVNRHRRQNDLPQTQHLQQIYRRPRLDRFASSFSFASSKALSSAMCLITTSAARIESA